MNEIIHARFIRAVSELELLGFIKPTKQKTDHVARLTWEAARKQISEARTMTFSLREKGDQSYLHTLEEPVLVRR